MTRIFWDANLFIYLLQDHPTFGQRVRYLRERSIERGDQICTSALALGEVLAGLYRDFSGREATVAGESIRSAGVTILPFGLENADLFARIRATHRTSAADSVHLASAATYGVDLFITNDKDLAKLSIPGIKFIVGLDTNVF